MELSIEQQQAFKGWVSEYCGLSELQQKLESEFGTRMTYMDVRFLLLDLGLELQEKIVPQEDQPAEQTDSESVTPDPAEAGTGGVSVEVDRLVQPGALVSGDVSFSDGVTAKWSLDQAGRIALDAGDPEYRPDPEDLKEFQVELRKALERSGFGM